MARKTKSCASSYQAESGLSVARSQFTGQILDLFWFSEVTDAASGQSVRIPGLLTDISDTGAAVAALEAGRWVALGQADTTRQSGGAPSLRFTLPDLYLSKTADGFTPKGTGRAIQFQIEVTNGGHTGLIADSVITVNCFARFEQDGQWFHTVKSDEILRRSCGCEFSVDGYFGQLMGTDRDATPAAVLDHCQRLLSDPEAIYEAAAELGLPVADQDAVNPNVRGTRFHGNSRPDNARWVARDQQGPAGGDKLQLV